MFNSEADNEEKWIEEEIQKELDQLDINSELVDDEHSSINEIHSEHNSLPDSSENTEDGAQCWTKYASKFIIQTDSIERNLEECDELLQEAVLVSARVHSTRDTELQTMAKEYGVDIETIKQKLEKDGQLGRQDVDPRRMHGGK